MSRGPYIGIHGVSYLPLIAASVIQAEDKRARNKIRTGSNRGLPYSPLRRARRRTGKRERKRSFLAVLSDHPRTPCTRRVEKEAVSSLDRSPGNEHTLLFLRKEKLRVYVAYATTFPRRIQRLFDNSKGAMDNVNCESNLIGIEVTNGITQREKLARSNARETIFVCCVCSRGTLESHSGKIAGRRQFSVWIFYGIPKKTLRGMF